jgi:hypothetical protein
MLLCGQQASKDSLGRSRRFGSGPTKVGWIHKRRSHSLRSTRWAGEHLVFQCWCSGTKHTHTHTHARARARFGQRWCHVAVVLVLSLVVTTVVQLMVVTASACASCACVRAQPLLEPLTRSLALHLDSSSLPRSRYGWQTGGGDRHGSNGRGDAYGAAAVSHARDYLDQIGNNHTVVFQYRQVQVALSLFAQTWLAATDPQYAGFWLKDNATGDVCLAPQSQWGTSDPYVVHPCVFGSLVCSLRAVVHPFSSHSVRQSLSPSHACAHTPISPSMPRLLLTHPPTHTHPPTLVLSLDSTHPHPPTDSCALTRLNPTLKHTARTLEGFGISATRQPSTTGWRT